MENPGFIATSVMLYSRKGNTFRPPFPEANCCRRELMNTPWYEAIRGSFQSRNPPYAARGCPISFVLSLGILSCICPDVDLLSILLAIQHHTGELSYQIADIGEPQNPKCLKLHFGIKGNCMMCIGEYSVRDHLIVATLSSVNHSAFLVTK